MASILVQSSNRSAKQGRFFRKHKIVKNLKTATIKQVIIHLSNLLKRFFFFSEKVIMYFFFFFFFVKNWKVTYPNTRLQFHNW